MSNAVDMDSILEELEANSPDIGTRLLEASAELFTRSHGDSLYPPHMAHVHVMLQALADNDVSVSMFRPGELVLRMGSQGYDLDQKLVLSMPVPHDVWYLAQTDNLFSLANPGADVTLVLDFLRPRLFGKCGGVDCLRQHANWQDADTGEGRYSIKVMFFETWPMDAAPVFPSAGPDETQRPGKTGASLWNDFCGYLAFPIGPLGVMEYLSMVSESMLDHPARMDAEVREHHGVTEFGPLNGLLSPKEQMDETPAGVVLFEKGYLQEHLDTEYLAADFAGRMPLEYHQWIRLYLKRTDKWPVPGEFVGLLAQPYPYQVWWHQVSCPFLYSGNWLDTAYYSSGEVVEVIEAEDVLKVHGVESMEEAPLYKVLVHGIEVVLRSTDFKRYGVGEQVALIRRRDMSDPGGTWLDAWDGVAFHLTKPHDLEPGDYDVLDEFLVAPIGFYQEEQ